MSSPSLIYCPEADDDLDKLVETHPADVGLIDALLEEIANDTDLLLCLVEESPKWWWDFKPPFEFYRFEACWEDGRRIYVIKPYDEEGTLLGFRVFVGHDVVTDTFTVLSVQPRKTAYVKTTDAHRELCARYDRLGIPPIAGG